MDMLALYKWTAIVTGILFLLQLVSNLFDFGFDTDEAGADAGGADGGSVLFSFISVRNVVSFLLAFSITGYFGIRDYGFGALSFIPGILAGTGMVIFNMYLIRALAGLKRDTSVNKEELEGLSATVIFPILANRSGQGKINVTVAKKLMTLQAVSDDTEKLERNTEVVIEKIMDQWVALVRRKI